MFSPTNIVKFQEKIIKKYMNGTPPVAASEHLPHFLYFLLVMFINN